ncbi:MAG TPA: acyl carrier protein [Kofleriaceae bacterium]
MSKLDQIRSVVAQTFGVPLASVTEASSSDTIEAWDSMHHLHLIIALEAELGVSIEPDEAVELTSVKKILEAVR